MAASKKIKFSIISFLAIVIAMFGLASAQYKQFVYDPVLVWHGANLKVRSLFAEKNQTSSSFNDLTSLKKYQNLIKNYEQVEKKEFDIESLDSDSLNNQLPQSKLSSLQSNSLQQTIAAPDIYNLEKENIRQNVEEDVSEENSLQIPQSISEIAVKGAHQEQAIPQSVLENVQKSTGISPDEVNEILDK